MKKAAVAARGVARHRLGVMLPRRLLLCTFLAATLAAAPGSARETLGVHGGWGAFRDTAPRRCFAIAQPARVGGAADPGLRPFASVAVWPGVSARGQLHIRLRRQKLRNAPVMLTIGEQRFRLIGGGADAWAPDWRVDRAILGAMRAGTSLSIETQARDGRGFAEVYGLRGAATAIDAAILGCR